MLLIRWPWPSACWARGHRHLLQRSPGGPVGARPTSGLGDLSAPVPLRRTRSSGRQGRHGRRQGPDHRFRDGVGRCRADDAPATWTNGRRSIRRRVDDRGLAGRAPGRGRGRGGHGPDRAARQSRPLRRRRRDDGRLPAIPRPARICWRSCGPPRPAKPSPPRSPTSRRKARNAATPTTMRGPTRSSPTRSPGSDGERHDHRIPEGRAAARIVPRPGPPTNCVPRAHHRLPAW